MRRVLSACVCLVLCACASSGTTALPTPSAQPTLVSRPVAGAARQTSVATVVPATPPPAVATFPPQHPMLDGLLDGVLPDNTSNAEFALVLEDLASGARTSINADQPLPSASLYKLGVAWLTMRQVDAGALGLDSQIEILDEDAVEPEPYGGVGVGDTPSVQEALTAMLSVSSNAAAHALLRVLGRDTFTQEMDRLGLQQTRVSAGPDEVAVTTAAEMAHLLRLIATSTELSANSRSLIAQWMASVAPPDSLRDSLPDSVDILDKTGNLDDASNVAALLETSRGTAILVVIDSGIDPGTARGIIAHAGQIAYSALLQ